MWFAGCWLTEHDSTRTAACAVQMLLLLSQFRASSPPVPPSILEAGRAGMPLCCCKQAGIAGALQLFALCCVGTPRVLRDVKSPFRHALVYVWYVCRCYLQQQGQQCLWFSPRKHFPHQEMAHCLSLLAVKRTSRPWGQLPGLFLCVLLLCTVTCANALSIHYMCVCVGVCRMCACCDHTTRSNAISSRCHAS